MTSVRRLGGIPLAAGPACRVYEEQSFRHLLDVERSRAVGSGRVLLLLLATVRPAATAGARGNTLQGVAESLARTVRTTDFVGWLRQGRVIGAVLVQDYGDQGAERRQMIAGRALDDLSAALSPAVAHRIRVRTHVFRPPAWENSDNE